MMDAIGWSLMMFIVASAAGVVYSVVRLGTDLTRQRGPSVTQRLADLQATTLQPVELQLFKHRPLSHFPWLDTYLKEWPLARRIDHVLQQTGWPLMVEHVFAALVLTILLNVLWAISGMSGPWTLGLSMAFWTSGCLAVQMRRNRRRRDIEAQLPDALDLIARAMQAGHALSSAISMAAIEGQQPLAESWRTIFNEINFGIPTRAAIEDFAERIDSEYVRLFAVSTLIQMETGGNMAEILHNTASLIRQRQQLQASVKVLSAEGRISALILSTLPFAVAAFLTLINPGFVSVLWTDPLGVKLLLVALALMLTGIVWMWRMIRISV